MLTWLQMKKYNTIISFLEDFELDFINTVINDSTFLSKFDDVDTVDDDFINYLLIKEDNLLVWAHKYVLSILISYYFSLTDLNEDYTLYFDCFSNTDNFKYLSSENVTEKLVDFNSDDIINILELLQVSFLNTEVQFKNGKLSKK